MSKPNTLLFSAFRAKFRNARAVIAQIRAGEWEFHYNPLTRCCCKATRGGKVLWVGNGAFFCDLWYGEPAFGLILRHWVWHAAARKECARVKAANIPNMEVPDSSSLNAEDQTREALPASACSPCPICGSNELDEDYTSLTTSKKGIDYQTGWIDCKSCGHEGPLIEAVGPECDDISHRVREAWNSQANVDAPAPVGETLCDGCYKRPGKLTHQYVHGPCGLYGEIPRFVFRAYHCQWCLAAENRRLKREGKPLWRYLEWKPDAELFSQNETSPSALQ